MSHFGPLITRNILTDWSQSSEGHQTGQGPGPQDTLGESERTVLLLLEKSGQRGGLIADYNYLMGGYREHGARLFKEGHGGGIRSNGSKLERGNSS